MAGSRERVPNRASIVARNELIEKKINPIDMLYEVYTLSVEAYKSGRGLTDKGDAGAYYLSNAQAAAANLMRYYAPQLGAIAIEVNDKSEKKVSSIIDAQRIIKSDPFFQHSAKVDLPESNKIVLIPGHDDSKPS